MTAFTLGNVVVYRVGIVGGATALTAAATAVFLDEYTTTGTLVQSIAMPTTDSGTNQTLTATGNSGLEGLMTRSADGQYILLTGYDVAPGGTTLTAGNNRVVGRVSADGSIDTTTAFALGAGNIRGIASADGSSFYVSSSSNGVGYGTIGGSSVTQLYVAAGGPVNARGLGIFDGQLYESTMSGTTTTFRIATVGTGLPTTAGQTVTNIPAADATATSPQSSLSAPGSFFFADLTSTVAGVDTLYVADSRTGGTGGLFKYSLVGGNWISNGSIVDTGLTGLTASVSGATVTLFGTTSGALDRFVDTSGYNVALTGTATRIAIAGANTAFRGVTYAPQAVVAATETISFGSAAISQVEGDAGTTTYLITLTRTAGSANATVSWAVGGAAGSGVDATDFGGTLPSGTATFVGNSLTTTITIAVSGDQTIEANESFVVTLSGPSAGYQIAPGAATQSETIVNDDVAGTFAIATATDATEGGDATFTVTRTGGLGGPVDVPYTIVAGTAEAGDFPAGLTTGTVRFEAGQTSATITVATLDDTVVEGNETFTVQLFPGVAGTQPSAQGTILASDPAGTVSIADVRVDESAGTATITLTRTGGSGDVTVSYSTADGSATAGADYSATSGTATFIGTATSATFTVAINNDSLFEANETFTVNLAAGTGAPTIGQGSATVTIVDNDLAFAPGTFAITPVTQGVAEGGSGSTPISFGVTRTDGSAGVAVVPYTITFSGPNAANAGDFTAGQTFTGTVTFADGSTTAQTITLQVQGDSVIEQNETLTVTLGTPTIGSLSAVSSAVGTIVNDDSAFAIASGSASEAAAAGVPFVVTRTGDLSQSATLTYTVGLTGGATAADFPGGTLPTGTVTFAAGADSATVFVPVLNDALIETTESFSVTLSGAGANQTIATAVATGSIVNDDFPLLSIGDPSVIESNGATVLRYTVTSSVAAGAGGITFDIATADGTATAGSDYIARSVTTATIAAGQTSYTFDVQVTGDTVPERAETVLVNLTNATGATIVDAQGVGIIDNDDGAPAGLQPYFAANFTGFTAAGFAPNPTATQLDSDVWRVGGLSDLPIPAYGGTYTTGDFARGLINGTTDVTSGGVYSPSANNALVVQPTGTDFENGGFFEAQLVNTTGFTATSFEVAFDWAYRNSGARSDALTFSYSTDGVTFIAVPAGAFATPGAAEVSIPAPSPGNTAALFVTQPETLTLTDLLVGDGNALYLRWTHTGSTGGGNRDEVGIDNVVVRAGVSDIQTLSSSDITIVEGTGGTSNAVFTITRSSGTGTASVDFSTADGTALAGRDYTASTGTVTFAEGERSKIVSVAINPDSANEANETFFLNLRNAQGVTVTDTQARATIQNDDGGPIAIYDIQGAGHTSAFNGQIVTTVGIVTAVNATSYWIQDGTGDGLFGTSDAIQVFIGAAPTVAVGDKLSVTATVGEFLPTAGALTVTQLTAPTVMLLAQNVALPAAIVIGVDGILPPTQVIDNDRLTLYDPTADGIDFYEALEGMLVTVETPLVVSNSDGRATFVVASGGIGATGINDRGGITLSGGDDAPERIQIFADNGLLPGYTPNHTTGDILGNITGILTYFTYPELLPTTPVTTIKDVTLQPEVTALAGDANHLLVASFNIENADPTDPQAKFDAIAAEVVRNLNRPDIIGLQEVQDADGAGAGTNLSGQATADKIIAAIVAAGGPTYRYVEIAPTTANTSGGEPGGNIRNGYLYNPERAGYVAGSAALVPGSAFVGTRSPLAATFTFAGQQVTLIDAHSTSRGGSDLAFGANQPPAQAGDAARTAQALAIKSYIDGLQAADANVHVVALGDFNGYYYETALSTLTNDGKLTNLYTLLPVEERYSYVFDGASQAFDNIIVSNNLLPGTKFDVVHVNAQQVNQPITDHDQALASIYFNTGPTGLTIGNASVAENAPAGTLVGVVAGVDTAGETLTYSLVDTAGGRFAIDAATGRVTTTAPIDFETLQSATITARVTDAGGLTFDRAITIAVTNVNEAPTSVALSNTSVTENAAAGTVIGTLSASDPDAGGTFTFSLAAPDSRFVIQGNQLVVAAGAVIDYEAQRTIALSIVATDQGGLSTTGAFTLAVGDVLETAPGTSGNDTIIGGSGADTIDAGAGNDIVNGGLGRDTITLGAGNDTVRGLLSEIIGDTITDFGFQDRIVVQRSDLHRSDLTVSGTGASTVVTFPGGGTLALPAGLTGGDLMAAHSGTDSIITFNTYLASLTEGGAVSSTAINGITNQAYLAGDTSTSFTVNVEAQSGAAFSNTLGVYEIDSVTGAISDVRIIAANVKTVSGSITVTGVEVGHQLGFFLVQDGANKLGSTVLQSTSLSLVAQNGALVLANGGTIVGGATTFFSHSAAANVDGMTHVLSGVSANGQGEIRIGFEDLLRSGTGSDNDFQDVVVTVAAVPMAHPVVSASASNILFAGTEATHDDVIHYLPANEAVTHDFFVA